MLGFVSSSYNGGGGGGGGEIEIGAMMIHTCACRSMSPESENAMVTWSQVEDYYYYKVPSSSIKSQRLKKSFTHKNPYDLLCVSMLIVIVP